MQPPATNTVCVWAVGVCLVTATDFDCVTNSQLTYSVTDNSFSVQTLNNIGYIKTARYTLCSIYTATPDMTRQSCLSCLVCWWKLDNYSERVQTSIFFVGDSLELSEIQFPPTKRTQNRPVSFVVSGVAVWISVYSRLTNNHRNNNINNKQVVVTKGSTADKAPCTRVVYENGFPQSPTIGPTFLLF